MKHLLIVEDDAMFREALAQEFCERGYQVHGCASLQPWNVPASFVPSHAIIDLKLHGASGLDALAQLKHYYPTCQTIMLTGYGSIPTAVQAMKLGALNYIAKPASIDDIERAWLGPPTRTDEMIETRNLYEHERQHIEKILQDFDGNISKAAKALGIHRQSLQRKLRKYT